MSYIEKLTSALPLGGHRLAITFADGFTASLDLEPALEVAGIDSQAAHYFFPFRRRRASPA
jgi:hypothetical protein